MREQFMAEVTTSFRSRTGGLALLPEILSQACVAVLGVAGAGISMTMDELRVPLGSSDRMAARAESLQTTLGEGPCLMVKATSEPLVADSAMMADRWPMFHGEIVAQTPFRCISSIPIRSPDLPSFGALDLYSVSATDDNIFDLDEITDEIGDQIGILLFESPTVAFERGITLPLWLSNASVISRMNVWVAVGIMIEFASLTNADALAALRAYAFVHETSLDEVADRISSERLRPQAILA